MLGIIYKSYYIDHYNITNPITPKITTQGFQIDSSIVKNYMYYIKQIFYNTDYGLIFEDKMSENIYIYDSTVLDVTLSNNRPYTNSYTYGYVWLLNSPSIGNYDRSFIKGQTVLANIGGIIKLIMIFGRILCEIFTWKLP